MPLRLLSPGRAETDIAVELVLDGAPYWATNGYDLEALLLRLQEELPARHGLACCLSCAFGTFSPFGGGGNAIYCALAGQEAWLGTRDKSDCVEFFQAHAGRMPLRPLTFVCPWFRAMSGETANYSDWQNRILRTRRECP